MYALLLLSYIYKHIWIVEQEQQQQQSLITLFLCAIHIRVIATLHKRNKRFFVIFSDKFTQSILIGELTPRLLRHP